MPTRATTSIFGVLAFLALATGNALSAELACDETCRRHQIDLASSIKKVNDYLNRVEALGKVAKTADDVDLIVMSFRGAANTVREARRGERLAGLYGHWEEYLNAQAECVAARATQMRAWEENGGWSGFAADMFSVVKLFSLTAKGTKMSTVTAERCKASTESLAAMKSLGTSHLIAGKRFVTEVRREGPWETATAFRFVE